MALDFPSNPTNGQVYANYIYDSSITAWRNVNTDTGIGTLNAMGLKNVVPTSVVVGSGSATTNANGTVTFSGATTISLNDVFSATYTNYLIMFVQTGASASNSDIIMRLRVSNADATTSYYQGGIVQDGGTVSGINNLNMNNGFIIGTTHSNVSVNAHSSSISTITQPFLARPTTIQPRSISWTDSQTKTTMISGFHTTQASYTGFTIYPATGASTIGGTLSVYGYTN